MLLFSLNRPEGRVLFLLLLLCVTLPFSSCNVYIYIEYIRYISSPPPFIYPQELSSSLLFHTQGREKKPLPPLPFLLTGLPPLSPNFIHPNFSLKHHQSIHTDSLPRHHQNYHSSPFAPSKMTIPNSPITTLKTISFPPTHYVWQDHDW